MGEKTEAADTSTLSDLFLGDRQSSSGLSSPADRQGSRKRANNVEINPPSKKSTSSKTGPNWAILEHIWPANERPEALYDPDWIKKPTPTGISQ